MAKRKVQGQRINCPPEGSTWTYHTKELLTSIAWRGMPINCRRLVDFLEVEHLAHAGTENGRLLATYDQLSAYGIGRQYIAGAISEAEKRGIVRVERGARRGVVDSDVNRFRLTYFWSAVKASGLWDWKPPTDDWKCFTARHPVKHLPPARKIALQKGTVTVPKGELLTVPKGELTPSINVENIGILKVPKGEPPSISGAGGYLTPRIEAKPGAARQQPSAPASVNKVTDLPDTWTDLNGAALPCLTELGDRIGREFQSWPSPSPKQNRFAA